MIATQYDSSDPAYIVEHGLMPEMDRNTGRVTQRGGRGDGVVVKQEPMEY